MKKLFIALVLFSCTLGAWAQQKPKSWSITPKVGLNISNLTNRPPFYVNTEVKEIIPNDGKIHSAGFHIDEVQENYVTSSKIGLALGVEAQYQFSARLGLSVGAYYSQQGVKYSDTELGNIALPAGQAPLELGMAKKVSAKLDYIALPILLNYYVYKGLALKIGVQPAYNIMAESKADVPLAAREGYDIRQQTGMAEAHKLDVSIPVGLSYDFTNGLVADLRYIRGIGNVYGSGWNWSGVREDKPKSYTSVVQLTVGYKFGL